MKKQFLDRLYAERNVVLRKIVKCTEWQGKPKVSLSEADRKTLNLLYEFKDVIDGIIVSYCEL